MPSSYLLLLKSVFPKNIPINIAKVAAPIVGKLFPKNSAIMPIIKHIKSPGNMDLDFFNILFLICYLSCSHIK